MLDILNYHIKYILMAMYLCYIINAVPYCEIMVLFGRTVNNNSRIDSWLNGSFLLFSQCSCSILSLFGEHSS